MKRHSFSFADALESAQKIREDIESKVRSKKFAENQRNWGWMPAWLEQSDEKHARELGWECDGCGRKVMTGISVVSDQGGYNDTGMLLCYHCLKRMLRLYRDEARKRSLSGTGS